MKHYLSWKDLDYLVDRLQTDIRTKAAMQDKIPSEIYKGMYGRKFLVIDDISDSGETLSKLKAEVFNSAELATLHYNKESLVEPDFWIEDKNNKWIVYPWETRDSLEIQDYKL